MVGSGLRRLGFGRLESTVDAGSICKDLNCLANGRFLTFIISAIAKKELEWKTTYSFRNDRSFTNRSCNSITDKESDAIVRSADDHERIRDTGIYNFGTITTRADGLNNFTIYLTVSDG